MKTQKKARRFFFVAFSFFLGRLRDRFFLSLSLLRPSSNNQDHGRRRRQLRHLPRPQLRLPVLDLFPVRAPEGCSADEKVLRPSEVHAGSEGEGRRSGGNRSVVAVAAAEPRSRRRRRRSSPSSLRCPLFLGEEAQEAPHGMVLLDRRRAQGDAGGRHRRRGHGRGGLPRLLEAL